MCVDREGLLLRKFAGASSDHVGLADGLTVLGLCSLHKLLEYGSFVDHVALDFCFPSRAVVDTVKLELGFGSEFVVQHRAICVPNGAKCSWKKGNVPEDFARFAAALASLLPCPA